MQLTKMLALEAVSVLTPQQRLTLKATSKNALKLTPALETDSKDSVRTYEI